MNGFAKFGARLVEIAWDVRLTMDATHKLVGWIVTALFCLLIVALLLVAAKFNPKARPLGTVTAILMPVSILAAWFSVLCYAKYSYDLPGCIYNIFSFLSRVGTLSEEMIQEELTRMVLPSIMYMYTYLLKQSAWRVLAFIPGILAAIYAGLQLNSPKKKPVIAAFVLILLRMFVVSPIEPYFVRLTDSNPSAQLIWTVLYFVIAAVPFVLLLIQAVNTRPPKKQTECAQALSATVEQATDTRSEDAYKEELLLSAKAAMDETDEQLVAFQQKAEAPKAKSEADGVEKARRNKKIATVTGAIVFGAIVLFAVMNFIMPNIRYNSAIKNIESGNYETAYKTFLKIRGYRDSKDYIARFRVIYDKKIVTSADGEAVYEYSYDDNGNLLTEVCTGVNGKTYVSHECTYDDSGNMLSETTMKERTPRIIHKTSYKYSYDDDGRMQKKTTTYTDVGQKNSWEYFYDDDGKLLTEVVWLTDYDTIVWVHKYTYDGSNVTIESDCYGRLRFLQEISYDSHGNVSKRVHKDDDKEVITSTEYEYDRYGEMLKKVDKNADGKMVSFEEYSYDRCGNMLTEVYKDANRNVIFSNEYSYDSYGNILTLIQIESDENAEEYQYSYEGVRVIYHP